MTPAAPEALGSVHEEIRACVACALHRSRTQAVPGTGPVDARIMAVGEAPGESEDRQGQPFVGSAGQVLTRLLGRIGLRREDIYITNVLKCRPPQNRDPEPDEVAACSRFLDAQVALIRPDVILLLGRHALERVLPGSPGIGRMHGQPIRRGERLYVPLYHPAAALHRGDLMSTLEADMDRVRTYLDDAERERAVVRPAPAAPREQLSLF